MVEWEEDIFGKLVVKCIRGAPRLLVQDSPQLVGEVKELALGGLRAWVLDGQLADLDATWLQLSWSQRPVEKKSREVLR